jgi:hypothetical protein
LDTSFQELNQFRKRIDLNFKWNLIARKIKKTNLLLIAAVIVIVTDIKNNILKQGIKSFSLFKRFWIFLDITILFMQLLKNYYCIMIS